MGADNSFDDGYVPPPEPAADYGDFSDADFDDFSGNGGGSTRRGRSGGGSSSRSSRYSNFNRGSSELQEYRTPPHDERAERSVLGAMLLNSGVVIDIVDRLLEAGAGHQQRLPGEVTVLMLAAALGLPDLCGRLIKAGADIHATDAQGLTALHCAALYGFTARDRPRLVALFDTLLYGGAEIDAVAAGGVTPLLLLLGARAEPGTACDENVVATVLDHLLDEGASLDAQDPRGFGPLHLTALHGLLQLARRLLRAGADPGLRDALNRVPRDVAIMRGFVDVAAELAPSHQAGGDVSMARFLRDQG